LPRHDARQVEQAVEQFLGRAQRGIDAAAELALLAALVGFAQGRGKQPRGMQRLQEVGERTREEIASLTQRIHELAGGPFTIDSPKQLAEVLFVQAKLPAPSAATQAALSAGGAKVTVRENIGQSHFAIITPGNPVHDANAAAMLAVLRGE
jgi:hypothetical protein